MAGENDSEIPLGRQTPVVESYSPELLFPISRADGRGRIGLGETLPFHGVDRWHAYELSWLEADGKPVSRVGRLTVPATSPCLVESKSLKLYLNSLNHRRFADEAEAAATITADVGAAAGAPVQLELLAPDDPGLAGQALPGRCIDPLPASVPAGEPTAAMLEVAPGSVEREEVLHSHLLRSLCPVTGQPDWASVWIHYRGAALDHGALLAYILAYRHHQEFHEQCVERMFCHLVEACRPEQLSVQACYTRRGGLDINPFRSNLAGAAPLPRLNRQ